MKFPQTRFTYVGFAEKQGARIFSYQMTCEDRSKIDFTVATDLMLARSYHISLQELPLMCRAILDAIQEVGAARAYALTEQDMQSHAARLAERADEAKRKRAPRRPHATQAVGSGWRAFPLNPLPGSQR